MFRGKKGKWILGVTLVLGVGAVSVGVSQWDNIKALYSGMKYTEEEIQVKRQETQAEVNQVLKDYDLGSIRGLTEEETKQLVSGELSVEALTDKITQQGINQSDSEASEEQTSSTLGNETTENSQSGQKEPLNGQETNQTQIDINKKEQELVSKYTAQMYVLQAKYVGLLENLKNKGIGILNGIPSDERTFNRLKNAGMPLLQEAYTLESQCDKEVKKVLDTLAKELKAINKDTSVTKTMQKAYETEKSLKKAYYIKLGKSML